MPTILTIDHKHYLVPDAVNLNTLTKAFTQLKPLEWNYERNASGKEYYKRTDKETVTVKIEIVDKSQIVEPKKPKQIPEKAGPDCNGRML